MKLPIVIKYHNTFLYYLQMFSLFLQSVILSVLIIGITFFSKNLLWLAALVLPTILLYVLKVLLFFKPISIGKDFSIIDDKEYATKDLDISFEYSIRSPFSFCKITKDNDVISNFVFCSILMGNITRLDSNKLLEALQKLKDQSKINDSFDVYIEKKRWFQHPLLPVIIFPLLAIGPLIVLLIVLQ
ncbi:hypothetical protein [Desulfoluna butyratoxydans]|uniref:Uncharacterized protein n=1 Tax=Desulfoluna butyratoxydans TaxID=231438 RepID=A0A4U8YSZ0_9BACT|nr:hypothetical protein [Desulfoluna butyratoxydans]VFQ47515.1 hypothetical protein MSL71_52150 [Desulfoluna butyratoxydans]